LSRRVYGGDDFTTPNPLTHKNIAHSMMGQFEPAVENAKQALAINKAYYGDAHPKVTTGLGNIGIYLAQQGKKEEARPYFEEALASLTRIHGPNHPTVAQACMHLGFFKLESGDPRGAIVDL